MSNHSRIDYSGITDIQMLQAQLRIAESSEKYAQELTSVRSELEQTRQDLNRYKTQRDLCAS